VEVEVGGATERVNFVAWLWGAKRYAWDRLETACEKAFKRRFTSKRALVRYLVLDCKMVRPDEVGPELAPCLQESEFPSQSAHPQNLAQATAAGGFQKKPADAAPSRTPAHEVEIEVMGHTVRIDWIAFLKGTQLYPNRYLIKAGEKAFKRTFTSKCALLRKLCLNARWSRLISFLRNTRGWSAGWNHGACPRPARWEARP
jgi:hypothetical protein